MSRNSMKELPNVQGEIIFGIHPVKLALQSQHRPLHALYLKLKKSSSEKNDENSEDENLNERLREILRIARAKEIPIRIIRSDLMNLMAGNRPHQVK